MLRFLPDGWLEALLRPFLMLDSVAGLYFEQSAPDLRFAVIVLFLALAALAGRVPRALDARQRFLLLSLGVLFYGWTLTIGNGRYFALGMLLAGPALVVAARALPGTAALRATALAGVATLQGALLWDSYLPGQWSLTSWREGPGLAMSDHPLRHEPAVFLNAGGVSFSVLVPGFHPQSRWSNIGGQREIGPGNVEWPKLQRMVHSGLPVWVMVPQANAAMLEGRRLDAVATRLTNGSLAPLGLRVADGPCELITTPLRPHYYEELANEGAQGFWFCRTAAAPDDAVASQRPAGMPADLDAIFASVEQRCPRFFPPGGGTPSLLRSFAVRHYIGSDVRLYVEYEGRVLYKYWRAMNPTPIGTIDEVRQGRYTIACDKLDGRYRPPWQRD